MLYKKPSSLKDFPFTSLNINDKLPYIPSIIENKSNDLDDDLSLLNERKIIISKINRTYNRSSIRRKTTKKLKNNIPLTERRLILSKGISRNIPIIKSEKKNSLIKSNDYHSPPSVFITDTNKKLSYNDYSFLNNISFSQESNSLEKKIKEKYNKEKILDSLDYLDKLSNKELNNFQNDINDSNYYSKKMIDFCDETLKFYDQKYLINPNEYLTENIEDKNHLNFKFNQFFDKLLSKNKNFNSALMLNLFTKKKQKNLLERKLYQLKIQKKHEKFEKLINDSKEKAIKINNFFEKLKYEKNHSKK